MSETRPPISRPTIGALRFSALQRFQRFLERPPLRFLCRFGQQSFVGGNRDLEGDGVLFVVRQSRRIVRQRRTSELVSRKPVRHLEPPVDTLSERRLSQRP